MIEHTCVFVSHCFGLLPALDSQAALTPFPEDPTFQGGWLHVCHGKKSLLADRACVYIYIYMYVYIYIYVCMYVCM